MPAGKYNFTIEQGATFDIELKYNDNCNNPIDLTDYSGRMQIRNSYADISGSSVYLTLSSTLEADGTGINFSGSNNDLPPTSGSIGLFISAARTEQLVLSSSACSSGRRLIYDLELYSGSRGGSPYTIRLLEGQVRISQEVTRV